jgi:hypothetical protein
MAFPVTIVMEYRDVSNKLNIGRFDTDSTTIGIDNRCTACISDNTDHFVGELKPAKRAGALWFQRACKHQALAPFWIAGIRT